MSRVPWEESVNDLRRFEMVTIHNHIGTKVATLVGTHAISLQIEGLTLGEIAELKRAYDYHGGGYPITHASVNEAFRIPPVAK